MFCYVDGGVHRNCSEENLDVIRSHDLSWLQLYLLCAAQSVEYLSWWGNWPTRGQMMLANFLAILYVMAPLLENMGLRQASVLCILGRLQNLEAMMLVGYTFQYLLSLGPPWFLMSLSVWANLFLSFWQGPMGWACTC